VDDGRGDMLPLGPDVFALRTGVRWLVRPADVEVSTEEVASVMLVTATAFAGMAGSAWRIADLPEGTERVGSATRERVCRLRTAGLPPPSAPPEPAGALHQIDGRWTVVVLAPLGRLSAGQAGVLARHPGTMRITPWRSVVIADLSDPVPLLAAAADAGLGTGRDSRWYGVSACTGRPGCGKAQADVRADAAAASPAGERIHWSGCPRRCGQPHGPHLEMVAAGAGYEMGRS
jgi:precorrin-3B synthase